jgi:phenylalanyl-tRNA synthetase beta chain
MDGNIKRNGDTVRFFETGLKFTVKDGELQQDQMLSMLATGKAQPEQWSAATSAVDFYDIKHDVESILALNGVSAEYEFKSGQHNALHPGQTAELVTKKGEHVGFVGLLHPALESDFDVKKPVYLVELKLSCLQTKNIPVFEGISKYPSVRRDLALIMDEKLHVNTIVDYICNEYSLIKETVIFDVYQGKGVESGIKSVALGLILQDKSKTLVDEEVEKLITELLKNLNDKFAVQLRE